MTLGDDGRDEDWSCIHCFSLCSDLELAPKHKRRVISNSIIHLIMNGETREEEGDDGDGRAERHFIQVSEGVSGAAVGGGECV